MLGEFRIFKLMDYMCGKAISIKDACKQLNISTRSLSSWESELLNRSMAQCNTCGKWFDIDDLNDEFYCKECVRK